MKKWLPIVIGLATGPALAALATLVWAQALPPGTILTGNELVNITTQGGSAAQLILPQVRNATNITPSNVVTTGTINLLGTIGTYVFTAALTGAVTANTPAAPYDGEFLTIANGTGSAFTQTITLTATGSQTVNAGAAATMPANSSVEWQYSAATTTWYRLR